MKLIPFRTLRCLCIDFLVFLVPCVILFYSFPFLISLFMPFVTGFILYFITSPLNRFLMQRNIPRSLCALLSLFIVCAITFFLIRALSSKIFTELLSFIKEAPDISKDTLGFVTHRVSSLVSDFSFSRDISTIDDILSSFSGEIFQALSRFVSKISSLLLNLAKNIPSLFVQLIATLFTAYFLLKEGEVFFSFFRSFVGERIYSGFLRSKNLFLKVFLKYVKAQLLIGLIIFCVLLAGMLLLKIKYAFLFAFLTALVDVVPVFGTGTVLLPMALYNLLTQNHTLAWGIVVLYGIALLTRQLLEPKVVGEKLGIHPLATIFSIYLGLKLFGVFGLVFGPLTAILIKTLLFGAKPSASIGE